MALERPRKRKRTPQEKEQFKRQHRQSFRLNDFELEALMKYYKKYKVRNRARFLRETVMAVVLKKFEDDYPTLFDVPSAEEPVEPVRVSKNKAVRNLKLDL